MAGTKLTDKSALDHLGTGDLLMVVDVSDTTGSTAGTSKKMDCKYSLITDKISLSNGDITHLNTAPKKLVETPGAGYMIVPITFTILCDYNAPDEGSSFDGYIGYDTTSTTQYLKQIRDLMNGSGSDRTYQFSSNPGSLGTYQGSVEDKALYLYSNGAFDGGWTADVYVTYHIAKVWA